MSALACPKRHRIRSGIRRKTCASVLFTRHISPPILLFDVWEGREREGREGSEGREGEGRMRGGGGREGEGGREGRE